MCVCVCVCVCVKSFGKCYFMDEQTSSKGHYVYASRSFNLANIFLFTSFFWDTFSNTFYMNKLQWKTNLSSTHLKKLFQLKLTVLWLECKRYYWIKWLSLIMLLKWNIFWLRGSLFVFSLSKLFFSLEVIKGQS